MTSIIKSRGATSYLISVPASNQLRSFNFFLINDGKSLTLIDAGISSEHSWGQLTGTLEAHGWGISDIDRILLTHHHGDHVGLVSRILEMRQIPVYAHPTAIPRLKMDTDFLQMRYRFFQQLYKKMGCGTAGDARLAKFQETIQKANELALKTDILPIVEGDIVAGLHVLETPGHSPDSISFLDPDRQWLFVGDVLIEHSSTNAIIDPDMAGNRLPSVRQHRDSLLKLLEVDANTVFPGHGNLIEGHTDLIRSKLLKMDHKAERIIKLIESGISTAHDLAEAYYGDIYRKQFSLVISEIIGHLDHLEEAGQVRKAMTQGVWHYEI
ncbi:MBL fold metallo-hydrolase [Sporosarcina sp. 179-K 3D1 HS]|uniref:MBL fold metallo-hydrolase n=1 Tax=Sporosarcina sp. 179-K 3D1 HS TaxID=3232169 RepID=UPI0039A327B6